MLKWTSLFLLVALVALEIFVSFLLCCAPSPIYSLLRLPNLVKIWLYPFDMTLEGYPKVSTPDPLRALLHTHPLIPSHPVLIPSSPLGYLFPRIPWDGMRMDRSDMDLVHVGQPYPTLDGECLTATNYLFTQSRGSRIIGVRSKCGPNFTGDLVSLEEKGVRRQGVFGYCPYIEREPRINT
jgi:hypothetical protein